MTARIYSPESQCEGKLRYSSKADAKRAAKRQERFGCGRMQPYRCAHCGHFHLGHRLERGYAWPVDT